MASAVFGLYAGLVYLTPIAGCYLADRVGRPHWRAQIAAARERLDWVSYTNLETQSFAASLEIANTVYSSALMVVSFVMAVILVMTVILLMALTMAMLPVDPAMIVVAVLVLVSRHVFIVVPVIAHEVDSPAAGVVLRTMLAPVLLVPWRYMKVNRRGRNELRRLLDYHRLRIDQLWLRKIADIDLAEESGLSDTDRHADVAGNYRAGTDSN